MDKRLFGKLLGEIYRIQRRMEPNACFVKDSTIYGLLNGFESIIDEEINSIGEITLEQFNATCKVLDKYFYDQDKLDAFKGFYDIEHELQEVGVHRPEAIRILTYLKANDSYTELIDKMNSEYSPVECKKFDLSEWNY